MVCERHFLSASLWFMCLSPFDSVKRSEMTMVLDPGYIYLNDEEDDKKNL